MSDAEQAARTQKKEVEALVANVKNPELSVHEGGRCPLGACTALNVKPPSFHKNSPLLDEKKPLIFVSSSMPIESLKRLSYQAKQHGAILVIRGMVSGSMYKTAELVDAIDHPLEIDPKLFERFEVKQVPVFVIPYQESWHKVAGNVELNFALQLAHKQKANTP